MAESGRTPRELIHWGADQFDRAGLAFEHGTDNALDEAASLVLHVLNIGYDQPDAVLDKAVSEQDRERIVGLLRQRVTTRKPAAYLLNEAWFAGMPFYVDERVLVPRSPIAELVVARFAPWVEPGRVKHILDLCTGSGCIAIACATAFPDARVDATDISAEALEVAGKNVDRHHLGNRVRILASDVFSALEDEVYDIIVSNPPYVPAEEVEQLPGEFHHEPALGLVAGADGLDIVVQILRDAPTYLARDGILVVEVGHTQDILVARFPDVPFLWLDFEFGGTGVFLLDAAQLAAHQATFDRAAL
jgi:ribosomal protein L3 glutamine methyltransferase